MEHRIWAAILVASLGWGTGGVASRAVLLMGVSPFGLAFLRAALAAAAVALFLTIAGGGLPRGRTLWGHGAVLGMVNLAAPFLLFTLALQYVSAGFAALMAALVPATTAAWAHLLLPDEPLHPRKLVGLGVALGGVALLVLSGESGIGPAGRPGLGGLLGLGAVVCVSFGGVYGRRHAARHRVFELSGAQFVAGAIGLAIPAWLMDGLSGTIPTAAWGLIGYLGLASSFLPFVLFYWLLQRVTATRASVIAYLVPLVGVTSGALFLGEQVTAPLLLGGGFILAGVVLVDRAERRLKPIPAAPTT